MLGNLDCSMDDFIVDDSEVSSQDDETEDSVFYINADRERKKARFEMHENLVLFRQTDDHLFAECVSVVT